MTVSAVLIRVLRETFRLDWNGIHGASHWARVRDNGLKLAPLTGARVDVIEYFAFLHDSCRISDRGDPGHGQRNSRKNSGTLTSPSTTALSTSFSAPWKGIPVATRPVTRPSPPAGMPTDWISAALP